MNRFLLLFLFLPAFAPAQQLQNVRFVQSGDEVRVSYDLTGLAAGATCGLSLYVSTNRGSTWQGPLSEVRGATSGVSNGYGQSLSWPARKHLGDISSNSVVFRVEAQVQAATRRDMPDGLVFIKGGTFQMGDLFNEGETVEKPAHQVTLSDFYMGAKEVTFAEYDVFCTATGRTKPSDSGWGREQRPAINVSWYDAIEYCNWYSTRMGLTPAYTIDKTRKDPNNTNSNDDLKWTVTCIWDATGYRLPTEAEWEYAAREGGRKLRFGNGKDIADPAQMNFDASASYKKDYSVMGTYRSQTLPAGSFAPNALGLYDMSGNVWEWCWDWYNEEYYKNSSISNPEYSKNGIFRVDRGGCWGNDPYNCRAAIRLRSYPNGRNNNIGFRLVRRSS